MSLRLHLAYTFFRAIALTVLVAAPLALLYAALPTLPGWLQGPVGLLLFPVDIASSLLQAVGHSGVFVRMYGVFLALLLGYLPVMWAVILATTPRDAPPKRKPSALNPSVGDPRANSAASAPGGISPARYKTTKRDDRG